jgi:hypothetical protein
MVIGIRGVDVLLIYHSSLLQIESTTAIGATPSVGAMRFLHPRNWRSAGSGRPKGTGSIKAMGLFCKFHSQVARMVRAATMIGRRYGFLISSAAMYKIDIMGSRIRVRD